MSRWGKARVCAKSYIVLSVYYSPGRTYSKHCQTWSSDVIIELFILLFADDVILLATTPSGLQNQLNCLRDCRVRKGGHLGKHEKWYYAGKSLNVVNSYTYVGFTFTTKLSYREGTSTFVGKGKKAVLHLCKASTRLKDNYDKTFFFFFFFFNFDIKIQPILTI